MGEEHDFQTIKSQLIYKGRIVDLLVDEVLYPDGQVFPREVIKHRGAVGVVPLTADRQIILVQQYRHPVKKELLEIPAGIPSPDEDPLDCAIRELKEETGSEAAKFIKVAEFFTTPGISDELFRLYLAAEVKEGEMAPEDDEVLKVVRLPLRQALKMVETGEISDSKTIIGLLIAERFIQQGILSVENFDPWNR